MKKTLGLIALLVLVLAGCASTTTQPDQRALHYDAGPIAGAPDFETCFGPAERSIDDIGDQHYTYPYGQRTFDFSNGKTADSGPITVVSRDNVTMTVTGVATFALNPDCETLREFHERIGLKYEAWTQEGWDELLSVYLKQPMDKAMDAVSKKYGYRELYSDPEVKEQWEAEVGRLVAAEVEALTGDPYFCNPDFRAAEGQSCGDLQVTIQTPIPPENIVNALTAEQEAVAQNEAQKQKNATVQTELESIRALVAVLGPEGYVLYRAVLDGNVQVVPVPSGVGVNIVPTAPTE